MKQNAKKKPPTSVSQATTYRSAKSIQPLPSGVKRVPASRTKESNVRRTEVIKPRQSTQSKSNHAKRSKSTDAQLLLPRRAVRSSLSALKETTTGSKRDDNVQKRVFTMLHRPSGIDYLYHLLVVSLVILCCFSLNLLKPKHEWNDPILFNNYRMIHLTMCAMDSVLFELLLRFWAAEHFARYRSVSGKWAYINEYLFRRILDIAGMATFLGYLVFNFVTKMDNNSLGQLVIHMPWWPYVDTFFRFAHIVQVLQVYRVIYKLIRPFYTTLCQQLNQLFVAIFVVVIILLMGSLLVYLANLCTTTTYPVTTFSTAIWHSFVAFSTLGYDDNLPYTKESIFVLCFIAIIGVWAFSLPAVILGNGLSIALADQRRVTFKYVSIAKMIRTAITLQQATRRDRMRDHDKPMPKKRSRLLSDHLKSFTRLNMLKNDRLFKINYDQLDCDDHSQADDDLWDKLLLVDNPKSNLLKKVTSKQKKNKTHKKKTRTHSGGHHHKTHPRSDSKIRSHKSSDRVIDCFENMDLTKYSGENSLLWYNLGLIEEGMDEMSQVVCDRIKHKLESIRTSSTKLMKILAYKRAQGTHLPPLNPNSITFTLQNNK